jgi:hypothetical protein
VIETAQFRAAACRARGPVFYRFYFKDAGGVARRVVGFSWSDGDGKGNGRSVAHPNESADVRFAVERPDATAFLFFGHFSTKTRRLYGTCGQLMR